MLGNALSVLRSLRTRATSLTDSIGEFLSSFGSMGYSSEQASHHETMDRLQADQLQWLKREQMAKAAKMQGPTPTPISLAGEAQHAAERLRSALEDYILRPTGHNHSAIQGRLFEYQAAWIEAKVHD